MILDNTSPSGMFSKAGRASTFRRKAFQNGADDIFTDSQPKVKRVSKLQEFFKENQALFRKIREAEQVGDTSSS
jgi:hypothetical protein